MTDEYGGGYAGGIPTTGEIDPHAARHAAEVLRKRDFYTDENGGFVGAPTNLTVDDAGMVHDATGVIVGRAGEVFVDANGNAINADGQIVGQATRPINAILDDARTGLARTATAYAPVSSAPVEPALHPIPIEPANESTLATPITPNLTSEVPMTDDRVPATYAAPEFQNDAARAAEMGYEGDGGDCEGNDPRNKYRDGIDGVAQNRFGDGVYGAGDTFASRAFGQNHDTEMLDHNYNERPTGLFGHNDVGDAGEIPNIPDGGAAPYGTARRPHFARHVTTGASVATNLTVDEVGNVYDAAGNFVGREVEVVAGDRGEVVNAAGYVVGRTTL